MSDSRPHRATLDGMTLAQAELKFNEYRHSPKGRSELKGYVRDERDPYSVYYSAIDYEFGEIGILKFAAIPNAVNVEAQLSGANNAMVNEFMAGMNDMVIRAHVSNRARKLHIELLVMPEDQRAWHVTHFRIETLWLPIARDIVEFLSAGATTAPPRTPTRAKAGPKVTPEYLAAYERIQRENITLADAYAGYLKSKGQRYDPTTKKAFDQAMRRLNKRHGPSTQSTN